MVPCEWGKRVARDRFGADLIELPGSHSPFQSRPQALADVLLRIAGELTEPSADSCIGENAQLPAI
jgi:hypothetical protein